LNLVLDASVALSWCFEDEGDPVSDRALEHLRSDEAIVPALWTLEVANGLVTAERRGRLDAESVARAGSLLLSLPIVVEPAVRSRPFMAIVPLARKHGLSIYDGAYLELALRRSIPLASLDRSLRRAARAEGVEAGPG
jgi:predicted nucleic acid-binding protein